MSEWVSAVIDSFGDSYGIYRACELVQKKLISCDLELLWGLRGLRPLGPSKHRAQLGCGGFIDSPEPSFYMFRLSFYSRIKELGKVHDIKIIMITSNFFKLNFIKPRFCFY